MEQAEEAKEKSQSKAKPIPDDERKTAVGIECRAVRCKCRFCPECAKALGYELRRKLIAAVEQWGGVQMWTFTVDPALFESPEAAMRYVKEKRCVSEWIRTMKRKGHLLSGKYFSVVEFHKSGWPHWHVLVEAKYVPFWEASEAWQRFRPADAPELAETGKGQRPGFGTIVFSKRDFDDARHAAMYATKYLVKHPEEGWPEWLLEAKSNVNRYSRSQGLFPVDRSTPKLKQEETSLETDTVDHVGDFFAEVAGMPSDEGEPERRERTIGERVAGCAKQAVLCAVYEVVDDYGEVHLEREYMGTCAESFDAIRDQFLKDSDGNPWAFFLGPDDLGKLADSGLVVDRERFRERLGFIQGELFDREACLTAEEQFRREIGAMG